MAGAYGWQEITINGIMGFIHRFPLKAKWHQVLKCTHVAVLTNSTGVRMYPPAGKPGMLTVRQGGELVEFWQSSVSEEALAHYVAPNNAANIYGMYVRCKDNSRGAQNLWHLCQLASFEMVMAKDFRITAPLQRIARPVAVIVHRNGIGVHERTLQSRNPPCSTDCVMYIPSKNLSAETLRRHFSAIEAAEILGVYRFNRSQLLHCLPGGAPAEGGAAQ